MKEVPFIVTELVLKAVQHLQDAQYDHQAEVVIGETSRTFVLVEEEEFKELGHYRLESEAWSINHAMQHGITLEESKKRVEDVIYNHFHPSVCA